MAPAFGANAYDGMMIGGLIHNYQLPLNRFRFVIIPLYAIKSKKGNAIIRAAYSWYPDNSVSRIDMGAGAAKFTMNQFHPEGKKILYSG